MKRYSYHLQLLALAWAGVLLVGATACGNGDDPNETPEPPATQPVLIDGKFSSWNSTSADGIFDDGAAIGLFAVEGAFTADAPRYINNARLTLKEGLFRSAASLMLKPSAGTLAAYTPHADRMPLAGTTATVTAAADQSAAADFAAADFMAATALVPADQQGAVQMTFHRMFSRIDLSFTTAGEPTLDELADAKVTLTLDLSADVDFATGSVTGSSNPQTTTPNGTLVPDGSTIKGLSAIVAPQRIAADEAVLNLKVGTFEASYPLGKELTLKAGMQYDFAITVGQAVPDITVTVDVTEHEWTEGTSVEETVEVDDNMPKSITDIEGNSYPVVKIGTQYWMAANLATTRYNDGTPITRMDDAEMWTNNGTTRTDAYCYPNGESANVERYGLIYNYYAVATNKLCPEGWHVPTIDEIRMTIELLGGEDIAGDRMKSDSGWKYKGEENPAYQGTNSSGFNGLPAGSREDNGAYWQFESYGYWWSSSAVGASQANGFYLYYNRPTVYVTSPQQRTGYSVRCIRYRN